MNRVERLVVWWVAALVVFAGGVLWFAGDAAAVVGSVCFTGAVRGFFEDCSWWWDVRYRSRSSLSLWITRQDGSG
jgi:hypothetical protein